MFYSFIYLDYFSCSKCFYKYGYSSGLFFCGNIFIEILFYIGMFEVCYFCDMDSGDGFVICIVFCGVCLYRCG